MRQPRKRATMPVDPGEGARPPAPPVVALRVVGTGRDVPFAIEVERLAIGSDPANQIVLDDRTVSGFHCLLERRGDRIVVRDRGSRNGTFVNGARVVESEVGAGAQLVVGQTVLRLVGARAPGDPPPGRLLGVDPRFLAALATARRAAATSSSVLVLGESGTGKELVARLVHDESPRAAGPLVTLNCGAIARELVESELFGHERGAFTGAHERRLGVFEQAEGGTLFLDEIGELPRDQQTRLLRVLETRRVRRVGGAGERSVDVRVVAATHRGLRAAAEVGEFRLDLYHRLAQIEVRLPALRERPGDIPLLAEAFLAEAAAEHGPRRLPPETLAALVRHPWPGNVRELRNAIFRAVALSDDVLRTEDLVPPTTSGAAAGAPSATTARPSPPVGLVPGTCSPATPPEGGECIPLELVLRREMERALAHFGTHRRAAAALRMPRSTFNDRARRFGLVAERRRTG